MMPCRLLDVINWGDLLFFSRHHCENGCLNITLIIYACMSKEVISFENVGFAFSEICNHIYVCNRLCAP